MKCKPYVFGIVLVLGALIISGCGTATPEPATGLANPASVYCEEQGYALEMRTDAGGGTYGVCKFLDGSECEEWAFYRGECKPASASGVTSQATPTVKLSTGEKSTEVPEPAPAEEGPYPGWESYVNADYGFAFRYPPTWTLEEEANVVKLSRRTLLLAIAFRRQGENVPPPWTGMPAGDFESRGTMAFLGQEIEKISLIYEGKVKALTYGAEVSDVVFSIRLDDMATADYQAIEIPEAVQSEVDQIVGSFETMPPEEAESDIAIEGLVMDVSLSARIIMLQEPVEGFDVIALTEESELVSVDGDGIALRDIRPGMRIQASGQPGESNALLARKVRVLEAMPTSPSD